MKLDKKIETALNAQLNLELQSWYAYLGMATYCESQNLDGFAAWLKTQASEELEHAMKFHEFLVDRGANVTLGALAPAETKFTNILSVFKAALAHEQKVSTAINAIYGSSVSAKDYATQAFLNWFVTEQIEEEKVVGGVVENLKRVGSSQETLLLLDREAADRSTPA